MMMSSVVKAIVEREYKIAPIAQSFLWKYSGWESRHILALWQGLFGIVRWRRVDHHVGWWASLPTTSDAWGGLVLLDCLGLAVVVDDVFGEYTDEPYRRDHYLTSA